ncbi:MAG: hypothetical protein A3C85_01270 [Candidatus Doudnabacteria bacterium RIFCSPHIGHO2_02_FULL_48_21]|nr:MAG: hypothetical protein A3K05_04315 [Candidatus Doudnabacteria bacterium RIFCSPHIGHO2_01_48_18]OGE91114.1 MAG: hypothetical protein A3F44_02210 [Candidatus Doudnabacteria bacterium RIFCSPHIGHO2_12_FULL_47_25]OGE93804.1 MAG: hypothetical protein A3C85_01270 [Candidatus Doudnabacteria bacterium RIFCSPHIGHO2_02_FULL_48_21]OGE97990.1 MAG: hypothetical protein A3A83_00855 [Candidatus Doudnabacteria bacterium RIFCSPLOWO2_01_FULL_48_57]
MGKFLKQNFVLILILAAALIFRFALITELPGGLFPDEAANGIDVNSIFAGDLRPFYERGNGREALFFYFLAGAVALFGRGPWQHHIVSAGFGFFEVLAAYFLTKRLFGKNVAYLAAFFMAVSSYAVTLSRTAFRANLVPLFTTLTLLLIIKIYQDRDERERYKAAALTGISFALGFYTYISYRMMIPLLIAFKVSLLLAFRDRVREIFHEYLKPKIIAAVAFLITIFPLAYYFITHPGSFMGRAGHVSIFSKDLNNGDVIGTFLEVFRMTMLGFFTTGDANWRHNISEFPFLTSVISPFFAISLIIFTFAGIKFLWDAIRKQFDEKTFYMALVAAWFWAMLVPEVTTAEGIPHGLRLVGVIPAIFIMPAWSVYGLWRIITTNAYLARLKNVSNMLAILFLSFIFIFNFYLYFGVAGNAPEYYYAFRSDLTNVSRYLNDRNQKNKTYLSLDKFSVQTVEYFTTETNQPYTLLDPANTYQANLKSGDQVVFTMSTMFDRIKFVQAHPDTRVVHTEQNKFGQFVMVVYEKP